MWRVAVLLLALCAAAGTATSVARAKDVEIKITVVGHDGKPAKGADLSISWPGADGKVSTEKTAGDDGTVTLNVPEDVVVDIKAHEGSGVEQKGGTVVNVSKESKPYDFTVKLRVDLDMEVKLVTEAADNCDPDAYDKHLGYVNAEVAKQEAKVEEGRKRAEKEASDDDIPFADYESAAKALAVSKKALIKGTLPAADGIKFHRLQRYVDLLYMIKGDKSVLDDLKTLRDGLPKRPTCKTGSMAPGTCPPGTSGGLLAGGLNDVFGTDLQTHCEAPQRHNDTRGGKHGDERERD